MELIGGQPVLILNNFFGLLAQNQPDACDADIEFRLTFASLELALVATYHPPLLPQSLCS